MRVSRSFSEEGLGAQLVNHLQIHFHSDPVSLLWQQESWDLRCPLVDAKRK